MSIDRLNLYKTRFNLLIKEIYDALGASDRKIFANQLFHLVTLRLEDPRDSYFSILLHGNYLASLEILNKWEVLLDDIKDYWDNPNYIEYLIQFGSKSDLSRLPLSVFVNKDWIKLAIEIINIHDEKSLISSSADKYEYNSDNFTP
jgi:hypothetical protein